MEFIFYLLGLAQTITQSDLPDSLFKQCEESFIWEDVFIYLGTGQVFLYIAL